MKCGIDVFTMCGTSGSIKFDGLATICSKRFISNKVLFFRSHCDSVAIERSINMEHKSITSPKMETDEILISLLLCCIKPHYMLISANEI